MNVKFEEIEPSIEPVEIAQDEISVSDTINNISLLNRSVTYQAPIAQGPVKLQIHLDTITSPILTPSDSDYFPALYNTNFECQSICTNLTCLKNPSPYKTSILQQMQVSVCILCMICMILMGLLCSRVIIAAWSVRMMVLHQPLIDLNLGQLQVNTPGARASDTILLIDDQ